MATQPRRTPPTIGAVHKVLQRVELLSRELGQVGWVQASLVPVAERADLLRFIDAGYLKASKGPALIWCRPEGKERRAKDADERRRKVRLRNCGMDPSTWMEPAELELFVKLTDRGLLLATAHLRRPLAKTLPMRSLLDARRRSAGETAKEAARRRANLERAIRRTVRKHGPNRYSVADALSKHGASLDESKLELGS